SGTPARYSWIDAAARRPDATASMMVLGPDTTSPPAKIPVRPVARVRESATIPAQPLTSIPAPAGRIDGSGSSPTATRIVAVGRSRSVPGTGSHGAAGSVVPAVALVSMQRIATTAPSRLRTSTG